MARLFNGYDLDQLVSPASVPPVVNPAPGSITKPGDQPPGSTESGTGGAGQIGAAAGTAPGGSTTGPASAADLAAWYQNWLAQDPTLQAVLAGINATGSAYKGQLGNEEARLIEQYGAVPAGASQYAQFLDPTVAGIADAATQGGVSTLAQLARAYAQQHVSTLDNLAARGMLRSGGLGVRENNDLTNSNQAQYNALQSLLSGLGANYSTYLGQQDQLNQETAGANSTAMQRLTDLINNGTITAPTTTTTTPSSTTTPGTPSGTQTITPSGTTTAAPSPQAAPGSTTAPAAPLSKIAPGLQTGDQALASGGAYSYGIGGKQ